MEEENNLNTNKTISQPPLDVLFNPSLVSKKDVWEIDVVMLLEMLLKVINLTGKKDLRVCGIAALSSSLIHRLKVESIFRLEKIAMSKKSLDITEIKKIPLLKSVEIPFRIRIQLSRIFGRSFECTRKHDCKFGQSTKTKEPIESRYYSIIRF